MNGAKRNRQLCILLSHRHRFVGRERKNVQEGLRSDLFAVNARLKKLLEHDPATASRVGFVLVFALFDGIMEELLASRVDTTHLGLIAGQKWVSTTLQLVLGVGRGEVTAQVLHAMVSRVGMALNRVDDAAQTDRQRAWFL